MALQQTHRQQLAKYLTEKKQPTSTRSPSVRKTAVLNKPIKRGKLTIYDLPSEIILKIFEYLTMGDLLSVAQVCHQWHQLSSDNLLWKPLLQKGVPSQVSNQQPVDLKTVNLKSSFMQRCIEMRNKRILRYLKKKNPYTGIIHCKDVESAIKYAGVSWQLVLEDTSGNEHRLQHQDITYHLLSVSVRWFSLTMIPVRNVKNLSVYSCSPLFFDNNTGKVISNGPYKRSLLFTMDTKLSSVLEKQKPVGTDENLKIYSVDGLNLGVWKEGGEIAFITVAHGLPGLVKRCILGSTSEVYQPLEGNLPPSIAESSYGLYGYSCTIQLRTMKQELWDHQFTNVECPNTDVRNGFAQFNLLKENDRQMLHKELVFPWKTDAFKGKMKDVCCLDAVLVDNEGKVVWFCSSAVSVKKDGNRGKFSFGMDFEYCKELSRCIEYSDENGNIYLQIDKDEERTYITHLSLEVNMGTLAGKGPSKNDDRQISARSLSTKP